MKISIITPTFNSQETISDTIKSIFYQTHKDIEYIVIDGLSKDSTLDIVNRYNTENKIKVISEKDSGIYDAMNKGVALASGEIIGILNSDDFYYSNEVLSKVNKIFEDNYEVDAVYGDIIYIDRNNIEKENRFWRAGEYKEWKLNNGWAMPHPSLFIRKRVYDNLDKIFNTELRIAADYELILRLLKIKKIKVHYLPEIIVKMRDGGNSDASLKQRMKGWKDLRLAWKVNNLKVPRFFIFRRVFFKINQFIPKKKQ